MRLPSVTQMSSNSSFGNEAMSVSEMPWTRSAGAPEDASPDAAEDRVDGLFAFVLASFFGVEEVSVLVGGGSLISIPLFLQSPRNSDTIFVVV